MKRKLPNPESCDLPLPRCLCPPKLRRSNAGNTIVHLSPELADALVALRDRGVLQRAGLTGDWPLLLEQMLELGLQTALDKLSEQDAAEASRSALAEIDTWRKRQPPRP